MVDGFIKIMAVSPDLHVGDTLFNLEKIKEEILKAEEKGVKILVFPELSLTGATLGDLFLQPTLQKEAVNALLSLESFMEKRDMLVTAGLPLRAGGALYDVTALISGEGIHGFSPKMILNPKESRVFSPGTDLVAEIDKREFIVSPDLIYRCREKTELSIGIITGSSMTGPGSVEDDLAATGATLLIRCGYHGEKAGYGKYIEDAVKAGSDRLKAAYVYSEAGPGESTTDNVFGGHKVICECGVMLAAGDSFNKAEVLSEIDLELIENLRIKEIGFINSPPMDMEEFSLNITDTSITRTYDHLPFVPKGEEEERDLRTIFDVQAYGLKKRLEHTGIKKVILGISGGLDSTMAVLVCARTMDLMGLPRENIIGITMPCFGTTDRTKNNAEELVKALGASFREIDIKDSVLSHFKDMGHDPEDRNVTYENAQARERTQVLMDLGNDLNALVVGTGDLSEHALGWATYNGDHMSSYGVNDSLPKTLIRRLTSFIADREKDDNLKNILKDILATPVSPELLPGKEGNITQKTEDIVGPYELHDFFLYYIYRYDFGPGKIYRIAREAFRDIYDDQTILTWMKTFYKRFFSQQFKRSCAPDSPDATGISLSPRGGWDMPSDACSTLWQKEIESIMG